MTHMFDRDAPPAAADADAQGPMVTRSEEQLRISTYRREARRARLTRYVETETVTRTVEVRREQARIEYAPIAQRGDKRSPTASTPMTEAVGEGWMVLYDEEVVVTTRRVPRERVRLRTHAVIEDREISEVLRQERIEIDDGSR